MAYFVGNKVTNVGSYFQCNTDHNSGTPITEPPNISFWDVIVPTDPNVDISDFGETINDIEIGSGEIRSCAIRINADRGAFVTDRMRESEVGSRKSRKIPFPVIHP